MLALNRMALAELRCRKMLQIVPGATHLFEEPGAMRQVMQLTTEWFRGGVAGRRTTETGAVRRNPGA
ncbi:hypothetical protein PVW46_15335 [Mameliella sp. AT18]|uniref:hypothetical protein n=1 Tax=Mameliella sp. AT18 TaxID=3028385 RepID=UPI00237B144F|nr:hypothetical protein [Mameliella sp. AT18]MDD9731282.1 hypothetical protein [Mameliella sp. AT18]